MHEPPDKVLYWEDLLGFRHKGGLSGHAEMQGKTLFLKFNTGPSGHGSPAAAGIALALKRAGAKGVNVFILEGEAGLTPGATHETANSAWGLALDNLYYLVDWNDFGIDNHPVSSVVYGIPMDWFGSHGFRIAGTEAGEDWEAISRVLLESIHSSNPRRAPNALWFRTRKGRGYLKYDNASHGVPHAINSETFWQTKTAFIEKYGAVFQNYKGSAPKEAESLREEFWANLLAVIKVLHQDQALIDYLAERLVEIGEKVPKDLPSFRLCSKDNPFTDDRLSDYLHYPPELFARQGEKKANREALGHWGAWTTLIVQASMDSLYF